MNYIEANWGVVSLNYGENGEKEYTAACLFNMY